MKVLYLFIFVSLIIGCEKSTKWDLQSNDKKILIVDGIITNEFKKQRIKLTYSMATGSDVAEPVTGASVIVEGKIQAFVFEESPIGSGIYVSTKPFVGIVDVRYKLSILVNTKSYFAETKMVPITQTNPLFVELVNQNDSTKNKDSLYHIVSKGSFYEVDNPAMFEVNVDWSHLPMYVNKSPDSCKAKLYFYYLPSIDVSQAFSPAAEQVNFPKGSIIYGRKYSLTPKHAEFIRSFLFETRWRGGLFDETSSNVKTNMSEGALGYFAACAVLEKTDTVK